MNVGKNRQLQKNPIYSDQITLQGDFEWILVAITSESFSFPTRSRNEVDTISISVGFPKNILQIKESWSYASFNRVMAREFLPKHSTNPLSLIWVCKLNHRRLVRYRLNYSHSDAHYFLTSVCHFSVNGIRPVIRSQNRVVN